MLNEMDVAMIKELCAVVDHSVGYIAKIAKATGEYTEAFEELGKLSGTIRYTLELLGAEEVKLNDRRMGLK